MLQRTDKSSSEMQMKNICSVLAFITSTSIRYVHSHKKQLKCTGGDLLFVTD